MPDPLTTNITAITTLGDYILSFATAALPPTQNRIAAFQLRYPRRYQRIRLKMENDLYNKIKAEIHTEITIGDIVAYVQDADDDLPTPEQNSLINVLSLRFGLKDTWPPK